MGIRDAQRRMDSVRSRCPMLRASANAWLGLVAAGVVLRRYEQQARARRRLRLRSVAEGVQDSDNGGVGR
jgi:hypothetical protein